MSGHCEMFAKSGHFLCTHQCADCQRIDTELADLRALLAHVETLTRENAALREDRDGWKQRALYSEDVAEQAITEIRAARGEARDGE